MIRDNLELFLFTVPVLITLILFQYLPLFGTVMAFKDYNYRDGIWGSPWNGFDNFKYFFTSQDALRITRNTLGFNSLFIVTGIVSSVFIALLLNELTNRKAIKYYQTVMTFPRFMSWVIVSYIAYVFLSPTQGVLNTILGNFGIDPVQWYAEIEVWPFILLFFDTWKGVGMSSIIYYSALMGVDQEQYEAATIDGANKIQQIRFISIPSIMPTIIILFILALGGIFGGDFGLFYQIPRNVGVLYPVTDIMPTYIMRGLNNGNFAVTGAVGLFQSLVGSATLITANLIVRKISPENSLF